MRLHTQPDPILLGRLAWFQRGCLAAVAFIGAVNLSGWLIPALDPMLFRGWMLMKANTAVLLLLSALSLALSQNGRSERSFTLGRIIGGLVFLFAGTVVLEYLTHVALGLDTLLAPDAGSSHPGRMSPQTATSLVLLGIAAAFIRVRKRPAAHVVDFVVFWLTSYVLLIVSGYAFGALNLIGVSHGTLTSPQTLLSLVLLSFVIFTSRAESGIFSIFVGSGVGSKIARIAAPFSILVPFMLESGRLRFLQAGLFYEEDAVALVTMLVAILGFGLILTFAWRIHSLEEDIRDLSIRDDLTKLYNRRGFLLLAERALRLARRGKSPFSLLFIDLDNLKQVNDSLGHDMGSTFIREMADLLKASFRETDVLGRIGGDEFVVAGVASESGIRLAAQRLEMAAASRDINAAYPYRLSFSLGHVTSEAGQNDSLEDLLNQADGAMYANKRDRKLANL